jgi:hypothetical protein
LKKYILSSDPKYEMVGKNTFSTAYVL